MKRVSSVGIILTVYNQGKFLPAAIESLKAQTFQNFTVHIVDDNSTDGITQSIMDSIKYQKAKVFHNQENIGYAGRINQHTKLLRTKYIMVLNADDFLAPTFLQKSVEYLDVHKNHAAVATDVCLFKNNPKKSYYTVSYDETRMKLPETLIDMNFLGCSLMRKAALDTITDNSFAGTCNEDWDRIISFLENGWKLGVIHEPLFFYRQSPHSMANSARPESRQEAFEIIYKKHAKTYKKYHAYVITNLFKNANTARHNLNHIYASRMFRFNKFIWRGIALTVKACHLAKWLVRLFFHFLSRTPKGIISLFRHAKVRTAIDTSKISKIRKNGKTNLLVVMPYLLVGGAERVMLNILTGLDREKYNIIIATTEPDQHPWRHKFAATADKIFYLAGQEKPISGFLVRRGLNKLAKKFRPHTIVMTNSWQGYQSLTKIRKSRKLKKTKIYDILHAQGTPEDNDCFLSISMPYDKYITKRIVISNFLKKYYLKKYDVDPKKIIVIHNNIARHQAQPKPDKKIDAILKKHKNKHTISYIGRLSIDKSAPRLVEIAKKISDQTLPIVLIVAGDGMLSPSMLASAKKHNILGNTIEFLGFTDHTNYLMSKSTYTLNVSNMEGMPMSIMESMHLGTPSIAFAVGGIPELIKNRKNGLLVKLTNDEVRNINSFLSTITEGIQMSAPAQKAMRSNACKTINTKFFQMAQQYDALFRARNPK